jgi:hypothetical protein
VASITFKREFILAAVLITLAQIRLLLLVIPKVRRGRVLGRRETMKFLRYLLVVLIFSCAFAPLAVGQQAWRVRVDAKDLDRGLLISKLQEHGANNHIKVTIANENYDYRVAYGTGGFTPYGAAGASASVTKVFDAAGTELFQFTRDGRKTDVGAANATAKEIIKRLKKLRGPG